jgi:hypothetical protein
MAAVAKGAEELAAEPEAEVMVVEAMAVGAAVAARREAGATRS